MEDIIIVNSSLLQSVDLAMKGKSDCNNTNGSEEYLQSYLDKLKSGKIIDLETDWEKMLTDQKEKTSALIENVRKEISNETAALNNLVNVDLPDKQKKISDAKNKIQDIDEILQKDISNGERLSKNTMLVLSIVSGFWIYFFYVNTFYTGLVKDWVKYVRYDTDASFQMFTIEAIKTSGFHWFIPLGILSVLGLIWYFKNKEKKLAFFVGLLIGLAVDFVIAYMINTIFNEFLKLKGDPTIELYKDIHFYMVLILGFGSQMALIFIFSEYIDLASHTTVKKQAEKRKMEIEKNIESVLTPALNDCKKEIENKKSVIELSKEKLKNLETLQPTEFIINNKQIIFLIDTYYNGWLKAFSNFMIPTEQKNSKLELFGEIKNNALNSL